MTRWPGRLAVVLALTIAAVAAGGAAADKLRLPGVKGDDDRVRVDSTVFPWRAIGRLNKATGGHCTAAVVGARTVLTAAHCLWNKRTRAFLPPDSIHFVGGWSRGDYLVHARAATLDVAPGYDGARGTELPVLAHDWAVVTLDAEVAEPLGRFAVAATDPAALAALKARGVTFAQAGYSQDKAQVLTAHIGCALDGFTTAGTLVRHRCDAVPGDSGSPILAQDGGRWTVVAIHVATARGREGGDTTGLAVPGAAFAATVKRSGP